ncbi:hypothetical protein CR513_14584, partial [Mucuna pruriens]
MCKPNSIAYIGLIEMVQILGKEKIPSLSKVFSIVQGEETRRSIMLDKGSSNTGFAMVTGKGSTKGSTFEGKPSTKSSRGKYCKYYKRP